MNSAVVLTDLSSAFDTRDHKFLIEKMDHIGVRGKAKELLKNFLKNRTFFVEIQGYRSEVKELGPKSVIQGSKLSSLLYTIYTLDIGLMKKILMNKRMHKQLTGRETEIDEENSLDSVAYVDDLTQIVANNNTLMLQEFIQELYKTTVQYFKSNSLQGTTWTWHR